MIQRPNAILVVNISTTHFVMGIITKLFIVFNLIFLCCTIFATESKKCDCDIYQIYYSEDENIYRNFTKHTEKINGQPIYYSPTDNLLWGHIIWWNDKKTSWMGSQG